MDSVKQRSNEPAHVETNAQKQNLTTTLPAANKNKTAATTTTTATATAANQNKTATTTATNLKQANQNTERRFSYEIDPDIGVIV